MSEFWIQNPWFQSTVTFNNPILYFMEPSRYADNVIPLYIWYALYSNLDVFTKWASDV